MTGVIVSGESWISQSDRQQGAGSTVSAGREE